MDPRNDTQALFGASRVLIGMIHVGALPGTPRHEESVDGLVARAMFEAQMYHDAGFHAVMIENMHDRPYLNRAVGPEVVAAMAVIGREVRRAIGIPLGVQVLAGANCESLAVALAAGATFIRAEGFVFAHVADEGFMESDAGALLRYRRAIGAEHVRVFADVKKKHSAHAITADLSVAETARAAEFALADGVVVTGVATGTPAEADDVRSVAAAVTIPLLVGSGVTPDNLGSYPQADGFIIGSWVKRAGHWANPLDADHVRAIAESFVATAVTR